MKKEVKIEKLDHFGRGIFFDDKICFVPNALPGEIVLVNKEKETSKYNLYHLDNIIEKSSKRVEPLCPYYSICGGCNLQHLSYKDTLEFKKNKLEEIFNKFKINYPKTIVEDNPSPYNYRYKIELKCKNNIVGFYESNTHSLVKIDKCLLASKPINDTIKELNKINIPDSNIVIRSNYNDEILIWIKSKDKVEINRDSFSKDLKIASIIVNDKVIYGEDHLVMKIDDYYFKCSYDAFFQINPYVSDKVAKIIKDNIIKDSIVADLYCGVGFLGILASSKAKKVYGIEIVPNAIKDALTNQNINKIDNMYFLLGNVEDSFKKILDKIDYLIIDPPRSGIDKNTLNKIIEDKISNVLYMSCDPVTLARDLSLLQDKYEIKKVFMLDMFSYTYHCESIVILERI